jgi:hypothetical protein
MSSVSIMCFSWNADGLRLCETLSQSEANNNRSGLGGLLSFKKPCVVPNFMNEMQTKIQQKNPTLVVMVTENEDANGTYFHANILPFMMKDVGYTFLIRNKLEGVGEVASGYVQKDIPTGTPSGSAIRISIFVRNDSYNSFYNGIGHEEITFKQPGKVIGSTVIYLKHITYGKFAFIALDIPSGTSYMNIGSGLPYSTYRAATKSANTLCLINVLNKFVDSLKNVAEVPNYVFLLGDFNYDINVSGRNNADILSSILTDPSLQKLKELQNYDELKKAKTEIPLIDFKEGVNDEGPVFLPTWKLTRDRTDACVPSQNNKIGIECFGKRDEQLKGFGWRDRILYKTTPSNDVTGSNYLIRCDSYERVDIGNMHKSTHAGVMGFYSLVLR